MNFSVFCAYLCLAASIVACGKEGVAAQKKQRPTVEDNVQRLLKTKSCPSCDLAGADLRQAKLNDANLEGANLAGALLSYADLSGANLKTADLRGAHLGGADLGYADFEGANLNGTVLEGALFNATKIRGRVVKRLIHADQVQTMRGDRAAVPADNQAVETTNGQPAAPLAVLPNTVVPESQDRSHLEKTEGVSGESSRRVTASLPAEAGKKTEDTVKESPDDVNAAKKAIIDRMFDEKRCVGCDLSGVDLSGKDLEGYDLERVNFRAADLRDTDLSESNLKGAVLQNAQLQAADLSEADLYRADFSGADLTGADLDEAKVDGADFSGAIGVNLEGAKGGK
jgi:uncharacterized protein YjbI with pentapeptide repeats